MGTLNFLTKYPRSIYMGILSLAPSQAEYLNGVAFFLLFKNIMLCPYLRLKCNKCATYLESVPYAVAMASERFLM